MESANNGWQLAAPEADSKRMQECRHLQKEKKLHHRRPQTVCVFSPNRFTCEGFLLLLKGCVLGPDDFEFVSGLVFLAA